VTTTGRRKRSPAWQILDNPMIWETSRIALDLAFGLYRRRMELLRSWSVLEGQPSVLDIGCGIGQYADVTCGEYLGIDLEPRYIEYARRRRGRPGRTFRCADVASLVEEQRSFDLVLMVDLLHHLDEKTCAELLATVARLTRRDVVSFEPIPEQRNRAGQWIVDHDRGDFVRPLAELQALFAASPLDLTREQDIMLGPIRLRATLASHTSTFPRDSRR
jgi:SAM-dependent methyltransferase